ncbi:MAG: putative SOS response-associated peptidase YedK, partial [Lentimonas sp.]
ADSAPRFRESWANQRCLLPANGFYEWYQDGVTKQPYYIYPAEPQLMYFAGLWFAPTHEGAPATCVILTTEAQPAIREIHDRVPLMLPASARADWLGNQLNKAQARELAASLILEKHTVSRRVNNVLNKDSRLIAATSPLVDDQMMLF